MNIQIATLCATLLGFFTITLDAVIVNVVVPTIQHDLNADMAGLQWVLDGYTLMFATFLLSAGVLSDYIGARKAFLTGLLIFLAASVGCGIAANLESLIIARFIQGAGAAAMMPSSMALLRHTFHHPVERGRAIALWALGGSIAATSGPVIGGLLSMLSWRWIFFINLPVGIIALLCLRYTPNTPRQKTGFDPLGQVCAIIAMGALTFGAIEAGELGLSSPLVWGNLLLSLFALVVFIIWQHKTSSPMVPPALFKTRNTIIAVTVGFTFMFGYFGLPFVMSLYLQHIRDLSPVGTGLAFLPMMMIGLILTPVSARLVERFGARNLIFSGLLCMTTGLILLALLADTISLGLISALMVLVGLGGPLIAPPVTGVLLASVPAELAGTASGVFNTSRQVGGALAVAIFGTLLVQPSGFNNGMQNSLLLASVVAIITAWGSRRLQPEPVTS